MGTFLGCGRFFYSCRISCSLTGPYAGASFRTLSCGAAHSHRIVFLGRRRADNCNVELPWTESHSRCCSLRISRNRWPRCGLNAKVPKPVPVLPKSVTVYFFLLVSRTVDSRFYVL